MTSGRREQVLSDVAERVALWNEFRTDDFQDHVTRLVNSAREHWRDHDGELPRIGSDPLFDALLNIADSADGSPTSVRDACAEAFRAAEEAGEAKAAR